MAFGIGVDIGGTKTAVCRVSAKGIVDEFFRFETPRDPRVLVRTVNRHIDFLLAGRSADAVGIATAGLVDAKRLTVSDSYNLFGAARVDLKKAFFRKGLSFAAENDANAWAFSEYRLGRKKPQFLGVLTLGTGVGCGLVFEGRIFRGTRFASEFGHCVVSPSGFSDSSGLRGTLEAQCNGASVVKRCREGGVFVTDAAHASTLAIEGNRVCRRVMQETGYWAGVGIANLVNALHLDRVVLAGGLSHSGLLVVSAKKTALKHLYPSFAKGLSIRVSDLEMGAAVGAALRARSDEA